MIIRSQNGLVIEEFNTVYYSEWGVGLPTLQTPTRIMGEYSTKEKARKVLDDLHNDLIHGSKNFQFPKDEDVKV